LPRGGTCDAAQQNVPVPIVSAAKAQQNYLKIECRSGSGLDGFADNKVKCSGPDLSEPAIPAQ
jgi:hypothetical protein